MFISQIFHNTGTFKEILRPFEYINQIITIMGILIFLVVAASLYLIYKKKVKNEVVKSPEAPEKIEIISEVNLEHFSEFPIKKTRKTPVKKQEVKKKEVKKPAAKNKVDKKQPAKKSKTETTKVTKAAKPKK